MKPTISEYIKVHNSSIHNKGVFASKDIPKGTKIIEYVGEKITKTEADKRGWKLVNKSKESKTLGAVYIFELNKKYDIDGNVPYNIARYINHACSPNCETENIRGKIWVIAIKNIKKGEELSYNYGYDLEDFKDHPCFCNCTNCIGYIVGKEYWPKLKRVLKKHSEAIS